MRAAPLCTTIACMAACMATATDIAAQTVTIAPQFVVVNAETQSSSITLVNTGTTPSEISFSTLYGYPVTDSAGFMILQTFGSVHDTTPSIAPWIQVFPQRLRLAPKERRVVRILVNPPHRLPDREYWARLVVSARGGNVPVAGVRDTANVKIGLDLEVRSVLPLFYRKGAMTTGVQIGKTRANVVGDSLVTRTYLTRTGNAAFVGSLRATLRDESGKIASQNTLPLGVFYTLDPRLAVPIRGLKKGKYQLTIEAHSTRPDVPARMLLSAATARTSIPITIP
jgi:P pilus assembly chaperone PapD